MIGQIISVVGGAAFTLGITIGYFWGQTHYERRLISQIQAFERNLKKLESRDFEKGGIK